MDAHRELIRLLSEAGIEFIVIGGIAAVAHGSVRVTDDLDIVVKLDPATNRRIIEILQPYQPRYRMRPDKPRLHPDHPWLGQIRNIYLQTTIGQIDILGELPNVGSYDEIRDRTVRMQLGGVECLVIDLDTLIASKKSTGRAKDGPAIGELEYIRQLKSGGE